MEETDIATLEARIDELITLSRTLTQENNALRQEQTDWRAERAKLVERNELAKNKIDAMIGRLRTLDEPSTGSGAGSGAGADALHAAANDLDTSTRSVDR